MANIFVLFSDGFLWLFSVLLSTARLFPSFMLLPWLGSGTVSAMLKFPLAFILGASLWQFPGEQILTFSSGYMLLLIAKELIIGTLIALFLCLPFWAMHAAGSLIDNQRGATLSSTLSPMTGIDSSEVANLFNIFSVVLILESGGLLTFVETFQCSYILYAPNTMIYPGIGDVLIYINVLMRNAFIIASPVITVFFMVEILLGLLSRYAPQMNAFSLSMILKTPIGLSVIILYLSIHIPEVVLQLEEFFFLTR